MGADEDYNWRLRFPLAIEYNHLVHSPKYKQAQGESHQND